MDNSIYLIGNGINRTSSDKADRYSWENLLCDLNKKFADSQVKNIKTKPFPFVYDEIASIAQQKSKTNESEIKTFIKENIGKIEALKQRYNCLSQLDCADILTTNYDYLIEKAFDENWKRTPEKGETYYSLYRFNEVKGKKIWHIHGEQHIQRSILLGFRHYMLYASKIKHAYDQKFSTYSGHHLERKDSWIDLFLTKNIKIIGLGMGFTEYHIWWLLSYRNFKNISSKSGVSKHQNEIEFIVPSFSATKNSDIQNLMKAYGVKLNVIDVENEDYDAFYKEALTNN